MVGAGIVGAAVASELAADPSMDPNIDHEVVVLEAEAQPDRHASGRSAAVWRLIYNDPIVSELIAAGRAFLETPAPDFADTSFLSPRPVLIIGREGEGEALDRIRVLAEAAQPAVSVVDEAEAIEMCPALAPGLVAGLVDPTGADIDVGALHQAYLRRIRSHGGRVDLERRVVSMTSTDDGWRVHTTDGDLAAAAVVNAAGAWGDEVAVSAGVDPVGLAPLRRTVATFNPGDLADPHGPMVVSATSSFYFKPETGTVLASPFDEHPDHPHDVKPAEIDVALLLDRLAAATRFEAVKRRAVAATWAGLRTFSPDRRPVLGWDPDHPGFFWAVGLGGFGIETSPGVASMCRRAFTGEAPVPDELSVGRLRLGRDRDTSES